MDNVILQMTGIDKIFPGVHALKSVNLELRSGEVHALMGENGAGKSTLMKVLCGIHKRDGGEIKLFGEPVNFSTIKESQDAGISIIHQELNMMNHLTVAQNIYIGREPMINGVWIDDKKMEQDAKELFDRIGVNIDPSAVLGTLTVGKQQMVEIAKAVSRNSKILILDEPTAALTQVEVEELFKI
ncbi:MAG: sugar ABC transporter ATP-binding protein, partial [Clostridia bacterium]|nr:sugar ABC transporter ATP-binding protein [Clostridia bacterium]